jgi:hypothetical protein
MITAPIRWPEFHTAPAMVVAMMISSASAITAGPFLGGR